MEYFFSKIKNFSIFGVFDTMLINFGCKRFISTEKNSIFTSDIFPDSRLEDIIPYWSTIMYIRGIFIWYEFSS